MRYLLPAEAADEAARLGELGGPRVQLSRLGPARLRDRLICLRVGNGEIQIAVKGNAHADEPSGTVTCLRFAEWLLTSPDGIALSRKVTFHLLPTANPDGLERNSAWFQEPENLELYFRHVRRDPPRQDREFGYGETPSEAAHPENQAWHEYLAALPGLAGYLSLHSMTFGGGAWFLGLLDDPDRRQGLRRRLAAAATAAGLPLHDEDRGGRKGFTRIEPGFCTAPTREEMATFFSAAGDPNAAGWLRLNSMQVVQRTHRTPVAIVSELPQWWDPELANMTPTTGRRAALDRETGARLTQTVHDLRQAAALATVVPPDLTQAIDHRAAAAEALGELAGAWGDQPAAKRDLAAAELLVMRAEVENAVWRWRLGQNDQVAPAVRAIRGRFQLRPLPLEAQAALQQQMIRAVAEDALETRR